MRNRRGIQVRALVVLTIVAALSIRVGALAFAATPPPLPTLEECDGCVTVIDVPAWDEQKTIIDQPAWDEPIIISTPDWTEIVPVVVPAQYVPAVPATQVWVPSGYSTQDWVVAYITDYQWVDTSSWQAYWVDTSYWEPYEYWQSATCWDGDAPYDCGYWVSASRFVSSGYTAYQWVVSGYEQPVRIDVSHYVDTWHDTSHFETVPGQDAYWIPEHTVTQSIFHPATTSIIYFHHDALTHVTAVHHIAIGHLQRVAAGASVSVQGAPPASGGSGTTGTIVTEPVLIPIVTTLSLVDQPAHTQLVTVIDQPAYDVVSTVVDQPAYDEVVIVVDQPATTVTTTVVDAPAYTVAHHDLVSAATTATRQVLVTPGYYQNVSTLVPGHNEYGNHWVSSGYTQNDWVTSGYYQPVWVSSGYWASQWVSSGYWGQQWVSSGYYGQIWQPDYYVPWHCWGVGDERDCDGGYTQPGYWYTGWIDTSHYAPLWVDTSHYENYWVDTSGYQQQWVDTSHWQPRWIDTSHYEIGPYWVGDSYITSPTYVNSGYMGVSCYWDVDDSGVRSRECDDYWQSTAYTAYPNQTYIPPVYTTVTDQIPAVYHDWTETIPAVTHTVTATIPAVTHTTTVHHDAVTHTVTTHYAAITHTESIAVAASTHQTTLSFDATVVPDPPSGGSDSSLAEFAALMGLVAAAGAGRFLSTRDVLRQTLANWSASGRMVPVSVACLATDSQISDEELSTQLTKVLGLTDPYARADVLGYIDNGGDPDIDVGLSQSLSAPAELNDGAGVMSAIGALSQSVFSGLLQPIWDQVVALIKQFLQWFAYGLADAERDLDNPNWAVKASAMLVIVPAAVAVSAGAVASATGLAALARAALSGAMAAFRFLVSAGRALQTGFSSALAFVADKLQSLRNWLFGIQNVAVTGAARLGQDILNTFSGPPKVFITSQPMIAYRYFGPGFNAVGRFMTTAGTRAAIGDSTQEAINALRLDLSGNPATTLVKLLIPSGTPVWFGNVAGGASWATQLFVEPEYLNTFQELARIPMLP